MVTASTYWRPTTWVQAFDLLERPGAVVLAGGTRLNAGPSAEPVEVVDLQALHLDDIRAEPGDVLRIGAMVTLQQLVDSTDVPGLVQEAARREQPSTLRAQGTVGGCIATGHAESELVAALLVHEAVVQVATSDITDAFPLERVLDELPLLPGCVLTSLSIRTDGVTAASRTARTTADRAIVAAFGRATSHGRRFALTGVARTPILVEPGDALHPVGDFRGSSEYRRALAEVLMARVEEEIS
jgi:carbon-monoxide dehydrogenase medium subunit/putative selenate reductase FAD-binding subunit